MQIVACDLETYLIADRTSFKLPTSTVNTSPFVSPKLVLGSWATKDGSGWCGPEEMRQKLLQWLESGWHIVWHNASYDIPVLIKAFPDLQEPLYRALDEGRVHDTKFGDLLYRLAQGTFDTPRPPKWQYERMKLRSLATLAEEYLDVELDKDPGIRLSFHLYDGKLDQLPAAHQKYAVEDAVTTLRVWEYLAKRAPEDLWGEPLQTRASIAIQALDTRGVGVDKAEAVRLRERFEKDMPSLRNALVAANLAEWEHEPGTVQSAKHYEDFPAGGTTPWAMDPCGRIYRTRVFRRHWYTDSATARFHLFQGRVREALLPLTEHMLDVPRTETGLLSLDYDDWKDVVPVDNVGLQAWLKYTKLLKIISTYLTLYSQVDRVYPRWNVVGARSGRMSTSNPNVQNVPKRKYGIRSLFVPAPGNVFVVADYSMQELLTLAEAMRDMGINGPLLAAIKEGADLHVRTASLLLGKPEAEVTKKERQDAKATNFGCPGGLGPRKLAEYAKANYGVTWTVPEAKEMRRRFLASYPDIDTYLQRAKPAVDYKAALRSLLAAPLPDMEWADLRRWALKSCPGAHYAAERSCRVRLHTGRVRGHCSFTEAANTPFQGLASDVTKEAVWRAHRIGLAVVLVVHDEVVVECPKKEADDVRRLLEECMLRAFKTVCPVAGPYAKVEISIQDKWGKATGGDGKEI